MKDVEVSIKAGDETVTKGAMVLVSGLTKDLNELKETLLDAKLKKNVDEKALDAINKRHPRVVEKFKKAEATLNEDIKAMQAAKTAAASLSTSFLQDPYILPSFYSIYIDYIMLYVLDEGQSSG